MRLLLPNSTDVLQPMDLTVNKPAKECIKGKFENWYADQIMEQLDDENIESTELQPISLGLPALKELGAQCWWKCLNILVITLFWVYPFWNIWCS